MDNLPLSIVKTWYMLACVILVSCTGHLVGLVYAPLYCHGGLWFAVVITVGSKVWYRELHIVFSVVSIVHLPVLRALYSFTTLQALTYLLYLLVAAVSMALRFAYEMRKLSHDPVQESDEKHV